ncbi:RIP metalloprotease RseP [Moraxella bovis]|uniref:RIP metalloprotease RseP n=1 Tax=Moraxella bovis TaxID=476 RepID=UPI002227DFDB|nr:RIP metalloprotease RseP [Moraxella bovis]UYZ68046.1 RIP metalloprotease RseP [Moraxella bovis]UZA27919.1 RIP metalloprotease RseP [Moraxella bovis]UZA37537.1 RIP metalloprotease RseP [Moraxella bovis]WAJ74115.1 RIP metalloprotease RseP [Moraxella bovis]
MTALYLFLSALLVLTPLVALHEWGHYIVARLCGVKVLTYSIGFGTRLFGWTSPKTGIDYRICAIPLGGYVKMLDEREGEVAEHERHLAFNNQHPLKKIAIVVAGPLMNFIIAIGLFFVLFLQPSEQLSTKIGRIVNDSPAHASGLVVGETIHAIDGKNTPTWESVNFALADRMGEHGVVVVATDKGKYSVQVNDFMQGTDKGKDPLTALGTLPWRPVIPPVIGSLTADGAGALMGLKAGDRIAHIDGKEIKDWLSATEIIQNNPEKSLTFGVVRDGQNMDIKVMPRAAKVDNRTVGQIGARVQETKITVPDDYKMTVNHTPLEALQKSFIKTYDLSVMTVKSMGKMITGLIGLDNLSGPITIAEVSKDSIQMGWEQVLSTAGLISLSLAVLNLLPIPVLDGGHLVFYTYELIRGKPMSERLQIAGLQVGMLLLFGFMVLAIGNDISRVFG